MHLRPCSVPNIRILHGNMLNSRSTQKLSAMDFKILDSIKVAKYVINFKGDRIVTWMDKSHVTESATAQIGCLKAGVTIVPYIGDSVDGFLGAVEDSSAKAAIFSPNGRVEGNIKRAEAIQRELPELSLHYPGDPLTLGSFPALNALIQTGFYTIPGTLKFRDILVYANPFYRTKLLPQIDDSSLLFSGSTGDLSLGEATDLASSFTLKNAGRVIVVMGNPNSPSLFTKSKNKI